LGGGTIPHTALLLQMKYFYHDHQHLRATLIARRRRDETTPVSLCLALSVNSLFDMTASVNRTTAFHIIRDSNMWETRSMEQDRRSVGRAPPGHSRTLYSGQGCGRRYVPHHCFTQVFRNGKIRAKRHGWSVINTGWNNRDPSAAEWGGMRLVHVAF